VPSPSPRENDCVGSEAIGSELADHDAGAPALELLERLDGALPESLSPECRPSAWSRVSGSE